MISLPAITSQAARIGALIIIGAVAIALGLAILLIWPHPGEPGGGLFYLPVPEETVAIVEALEASPPQARPLILKALTTSVVTVRVADEFPPVPPGLIRSAQLEALFQRYSEALQDRPFRVDVQHRLLPSFFSLDPVPSEPSIQMSIRMRTGEVLVVERRPPVLVRSYLARLAAGVALASLALLAVLALAVRQTAHPVNRLAHAVRAFSLDGASPPLPITGPRELRDLSGAFNEMQKRIRALVEERTRVFGAIAHDLRTYLTRMRLRADFIADADQRQRAETDIEEMSQILDDILLFSQQAADAPSAMVTVDLFEEAERFVRVRQEIGQPVTLEGERCAAKASCPPLSLRRMLANLVDNALRYGERAHVRVESHGDFTFLVVDDDGPGIPPEALDRVLRPFERLDASRARSTGGVGLGLSIVKALADSAGANLALENMPMGGLRASVAFPALRGVHF